MGSLGEPLTGRDAHARTFDHVFARQTPRNPNVRTTVKAQPVPHDPNTELTPQLIIQVLREVSWHFFPKLAPKSAPVG